MARPSRPRRSKFTAILAAIVASGAAWGTAARAEFSPTTLSIEQVIVARIQPALQTVDPIALASVQITLRKSQKRLPGTPFTVKELSVKSDDGAVELAGMEVTLYLSDTRYSESLKKLASKLIGPMPVEPRIQVQQLPQDIVTAFKVAQAKREAADRKPAATPTPTPTPTPTMTAAPPQPSAQSSARDEALKKSIDEWRGSQEKWQKEQSQQWQQGQDQISQRNQTWLMVAVGIGLVVLLGVAFQLISSRGLQSTLKGVEQAVTGVGSQLAESGGGTQDTPEVSAAAGVVSGGAGGSSGDNTPAKLSEDALRALLMDAYWLAEDGYAAWIWGTLPSATQSALLAKDPVWASYARYVATCKPVDLGAHQDPSYLSALPLGHLSQADLQNLLGSQPGLYTLLPRLRQERLPLTVVQRLSLESSAPLDLAAARALLAGVPASAAREIVAGAPLPIHSIEEEVELMQSGALNLDILKRIPSLLIVAMLEDPQIKTILEGFSAKELANAWIGPDEVLSKLKGALPAAKAELLDSYLEKARPSRTSSAFERLRSAAFAAAAQAEHAANQGDSAPPGDQDAPQAA